MENMKQLRRIIGTWKLVLLVGVVATALAVAGCGSGETTTVTETVGAAAAASPEPPETSDTPTATTIPDGTWKRGAEYQPGTYRAPGGERCWWEQRQRPGGEAGGEGFNSNYGSEERNILLEIDSPYFKTEHCGAWERVDE